MTGQFVLRDFVFNERNVKLIVPDIEAVKLQYGQNDPVPYWAKLWPAAIALCGFLAEHPTYIKDKKVLELAAGLGLPSLFSAWYAKEVYCTDYDPQAVELMKRSVEENGFSNVACGVVNWNFLPENISAGVLLLSDVNYDRLQFEILYDVLEKFINAGTVIILATPQRLMAKPFIERLLKWCAHQEERIVEDHNGTYVTVMVLQRL